MTEQILQNLPQNIEAEQALLSSVLMNNRVYERVSDFLRADDFAERAHQRIYEACELLISKGHLADPITLKNYFEQSGTLDDVGGFDYLAKISDAGLSAVNTVEYARLIHDRSLRRRLIDIGQGIVADAHTPSLDVPATQQIESAEQKLFDLATTGEAETKMESLKNSLTKSLKLTEYAYQMDGNISGVASGFKDLDNKIGGFHPSDLVILAARPGMGKTNLAINFAFNVANEVLNGRAPEHMKGPAVFFSLEMSSDQLAARILASQAEVSASAMRTGNISEQEFSKLSQFSRALAEVPLFIDDTAGISVPAIRTRARRLKRQHGGLSMIVLDYIQLLSAPGGGNSQDNRVQELSEMTRGLKLLAKELNVPVVALSQLNRGVEQRTDKRPMLSDLRESGSIEQDADMVMFIYREEYYREREMRENNNADVQVNWDRIRNRAELIISKQRHGPTGTIPLAFFGEFSKFTDLYEVESN
ncbi:MAG: replicative DNA helicase [Alphaproteobacteria bacterium]|nr:replicative DNA helicase [Alphaproteobacteria bacterium]MBN2779506.1 replicative DNA helicase [Alphaproteobacteria bacterium]